MLPYQREFIEFSLSQKVLKFADFSGEEGSEPYFELKSGRHSPYFFNAGLFCKGSALAKLGKFYAEAIVKSRLEFDVIFGPAYKVVFFFFFLWLTCFREVSVSFSVVRCDLFRFFCLSEDRCSYSLRS